MALGCSLQVFFHFFPLFLSAEELLALQSPPVPRRQAAVVLEVSRVPFPFCASHYICPPQQILFCLQGETLCIHVTLPLASNFKINCL